MNRNAAPLVLSALFWGALAFTLVMALLPAPPVLVETSDKAMHMAAFAVLSLLAFFAFPRRQATELFLWLAGLGALIEVLQMIPALHRDAELLDWAADCLAIAGILVLCRAVRVALR